MARTAGGAERTAALLSGFGVLRFTGRDVLSFLQGYLTIDTEALPSTGARLAALTNLQGRVVASGWCASAGTETVDWIIHGSLTQAVADFMQRYLAFSRTSLTIRQDDHLVVGLLEPGQPPSALVLDSTEEVHELLHDSATGSVDDWVAGCIDARIALVSQPTAEAFLPQMLGLVDAGAVDFDKGCYLGQEVVARAQHRGSVKRGLVQLAGTGGALQAGDTLTDATGQALGTVITAVPVAGGQHCLAVVRLPEADAYLADGVRLTPFERST